MHHHQSRAAGRHAHPGGLSASGSGALQPPAPTPILKPTEVKRQFMLHADFQSYAKAVKKFMNGNLTKTEFHAELAKVLPTKEKRTYRSLYFDSTHGTSNLFIIVVLRNAQYIFKNSKFSISNLHWHQILLILHTHSRSS